MDTTMIEDTTNRPMPISAARTYLREHHKIDATTQTIWNWTRRGKCGVKLATVDRSEVIAVTAEMIDRFIEEVTEAHRNHRTI